MAEKRRTFSASEKAAIVREHLPENVPVSDLCDRHGLNPNLFCRWPKELFENGAMALEHRGNGRERSRAGNRDCGGHRE